jgi:hypothetical protein
MLDAAPRMPRNEGIPFFPDFTMFLISEIVNALVFKFLAPESPKSPDSP